MLDVVEYLTDGLRNSKGHAAVHVMLEEPDEKPEVINDHSIEFFPVQFSDVFVSENASVDGKFSQAFEYMVNRRMKLSFNSSVRLMGNRLPSLQTPTTSSSSSHAEGQGQERHATSGRITSDGGRSSRPTASTKPVALQGNACPKQGDEQQVRHLGQLPPVRVPSMVQASSWQPSQLHGDDERHQCEASFGRTTRSSTSSSNAYGRVGARYDREGGGRGAHQDHADGLREDHAEECGEDQQGQIGRDGRKGKRVCFSDPKTSHTNTRAWPFSCVKRMATGLSQQDGPQHGLRAPDSGGEGAPHAACGRTGSSAGDQCEHQLGHGAGA